MQSDVILMPLPSRTGTLLVQTSSVISGFLQPLDAEVAEHRVAHAGHDFLRAVLLQKLRGGGERAGGLGEIVHEDDRAAFDFADEGGRGDFRRALAAFRDDGEARVERLRVGVRHLQSADIRRDDDRVVQVFRFEILEDDRRGEKVIHRDVEEPCDLLSVEVHGEHAVHAGRHEEIRDELRGDGHARLILSILPGISEKRQHCRDARRARTPGRVHHDEQLHQVLVRRRAGRLDDEHVASADVLVDLHHRLAVGERRDRRVAELDLAIVRDALREHIVRGATEDFQLCWRSVKHPEKGAGL